MPIFFGRVFNVFDFQPVQAATVVRLDRDICIVVDRSSSMKLFLTDTAPTMSTGDSRFCQPPNMALSRWGALSVGIDRFVNALATTPQSEYVGTGLFGSTYTACSYTNNAPTSTSRSRGDHAAVTSAMAHALRQEVQRHDQHRRRHHQGHSSVDLRLGPTLCRQDDGPDERRRLHRGHAAQPGRAQAAAQDIIIHTITFGEANPAEMKAIADATGGNNYIAPNAAALQDIFEEIALTLPVVFTD